MFAGISQAGAGIAGGLQGAMDAMQKRKDKAKLEADERKAYNQMARIMKDQGLLDEATFHELQNADTATVKGTIDGLKFSEAMKSLKQEGQYRDLRTKALGSEMAEAERVRGARQTFQQGLDPTFVTPGISGMFPRPAMPPPQETLQMALQAGLPMQDVQSLSGAMENVAQAGGATGLTPVPYEDPVTRARFVQYGRQILPSGVNPERPLTGQPIEGARGWVQIGGKPYRIPEGDYTESSIANTESLLAQLRSMKARGVKTAKVSGKEAKEGGFLVFGERPIDDVIAGLDAQLKTFKGGGPAAVAGAPGPAATGVDAAAAEGIRQQFRAGKLSKDEALKQLRALGLK